MPQRPGPDPDARGRRSRSNGLARALRGRFFMGWMITLGSLYLLLIVALLVGNVQYMHGESLDNLRREKESISWTDYLTAWGQFLDQTLLNEHVGYATMLSFVTSTVTVVLALLVGIPTAYILSRRKFWGITLIDTILDIPIVLPPLVIGVSLLIFFQTGAGRAINALAERLLGGGLVFQPAGIVLAQFTVACAFGIRTLKATFEQIDPRIEAVARTLGASKGQAFFRLTLPMSRDGILAAGVMTWARAIGEFGPILIFSGTTRMRTEVLPTAVFLEFQVGNLQAALAVSMLMILISVATLLVFKKVGGIRFV